MNFFQIKLALTISFSLIFFLYIAVGLKQIRDCYKLFFCKKYWTDYNIAEAASWLAKAIIIVPGLVFNINLPYMYFLTLLTSCTLIWASNKKLLPTLVSFNTLWVIISVCVLVKTFY